MTPRLWAARTHRVAAVALALVVVTAIPSGASIPAPTTSAIALPAGAVSSKQVAFLTAVACPHTNTCTAVGAYRSSAGNMPLVASEINGHWLQAQVLMPPANAIESTATNGRTTELLGVGCSAVGDCVAVGTFQVSVDGFAPLIAVESDGSWAPAIEPALPTHALSTPIADLDAVTCPSDGSCEAVGSFTTTSDSEEPWSISEVGSAWSAPLVPSLPPTALSADQESGLLGLSCPTTGNCVAVGEFVATTAAEPMILTERSGKWVADDATSVTLPDDASSSVDDTVDALDAVSCPTIRTCVAVGQYVTTSSTIASMGDVESTGSWPAATEIDVPTIADASGEVESQLDGVSCDGATGCVAVGGYGSSSVALPDASSESDGSWTTATESPLPSGASTSGELSLNDDVVCFSITACLTVGAYTTSRGDEPFVSTPRTVPDAPHDVTAQFASRKVNIHWSAPAYTGLTPITSYEVVTSPGGAECTTTALTCGVTGLTNGRTYTFAVTATNVVGTSIAADVSATPATRPGAPTIESVRALVDGFQIIVGAPARDGGARVTNYEYSLTGSAPWITRPTRASSRIITITGLAPRRRYVLAVRAVNVAGPGPRSARVAKVTREATPPAA